MQTYVCLCPFRLLTLRTSFYTYIYSQVLVYMYFMMYSFVSEPLLCKIPYVGALASAHTLKLFGCMQKLTSIHMLYHRCDCIWTDILQTHICLCPCESSHLEPFVYIHKSRNVHIYYIIDTFVYERMLCKLTYVCDLFDSSHSEPLFIHTYIHKY